MKGIHSLHMRGTI